VPIVERNSSLLRSSARRFFECTHPDFFQIVMAGIVFELTVFSCSRAMWQTIWVLAGFERSQSRNVSALEQRQRGAEG
jgi:hypothetical protein